MENPKTFISYSWSNTEHEQWVLKLATELRESGVDVILDKWELKEGYDAFKFMEKMVTDPEIEKVIIVCDKTYAEKADARKGGVGTETQIISPELYSKTEQNKFVAILAERDEQGNAHLPTYYKSRIYIDLSDDEIYAKNFERLLYWVYNKPIYIKPEIGTKPSFLSDSNAILLGTTTKFQKVLDAIKNDKGYTKGALSDYFDVFVQNLEKFRIQDDRDGEFDEKIIENINKFIPYRNELLELFIAVAKYRNRNTPELYQQIHRFFEELIPFLERPEGITNWRTWDFDNFKFIIHELFLYCIAALLKYECFDGVEYLLTHGYYGERPNHGSTNMWSFLVFREHLESLEHRTQRLKLGRLSLHADLLEVRSSASGVAFRQLMQADFVLFIRSCIDSLKESKDMFSWHWWPVSLLYASFRSSSGAFEIFARAESKNYFEKLKCIFNIQGKNELDSLMKAFDEGKLTVPRWAGYSISPKWLINYELLSTKA